MKTVQPETMRAPDPPLPVISEREQRANKELQMYVANHPDYTVICWVADGRYKTLEAGALVETTIRHNLKRIICYYNP